MSWINRDALVARNSDALSHTAGIAREDVFPAHRTLFEFKLSSGGRLGTPTGNAYIESFNWNFRDECLNTNWFMSLEDAQDKIERWQKDYNEFRPHSD